MHRVTAGLVFRLPPDVVAGRLLRQLSPAKGRPSFVVAAQYGGSPGTVKQNSARLMVLTLHHGGGTIRAGVAESCALSQILASL